MLAELSWRDLVPAIWLPDPEIRRERELARYRQSDRRGPISKDGSRYLRWALFEAALHACNHPIYRERYRFARNAALCRGDARTAPKHGKQQSRRPRRRREAAY